MTDDERAIRAVVDAWFEATRSGNLDAVLELMTDDVVFMVPEREPFGKREFAAAAKEMANIEMNGTSEIVELRVLGDWAYVRNYIDLTMTPQSGAPMRRSGYTLTIFRKERDGQWRLARDANMLAKVA
ncbi:MAG: YybH family protein [Gemmatimonas sp.]|nr:SgcJ/EcaC family oxidoreductase [Gemmatimonadaceae bacterium]